MFGFIKDPYGKWGNMPEVPYPRYIPEDDPTAEHLMGCLYGMTVMMIVFIFLLIIYLLVI